MTVARIIGHNQKSIVLMFIQCITKQVYITIPSFSFEFLKLKACTVTKGTGKQ